MSTSNRMMNLNCITKLKKSASKSTKGRQSVDKLKARGWCCSYPVNSEKGKECGVTVEGERGSNHHKSTELCHNADWGGTEINKEFAEKECEGAQHMDLVHLEETVIGSCASRQCVENLHNNMEIEESMLQQKHCQPIKMLPAITICDRKCSSFVNRELPFIKICPERGRYRVGPFLMPRPFGIEEESLINFCMDETLNKGEMLFQTNFNEITRNDIMSLSPRSIINMKVVSAVSELLSAQTTVNVRQSKFNLFMPAYNTLQDNAGGEYRDASVAVGKFLPADLYAKNIASWEKIFVPVNCGLGRWYMLVLIISEMRVEIWDPIRTSMCMHYNIAICKRVLRSIEMMLDHGGSNVYSSSLKLRDFSIDYTQEPCICGEYDCALYIILMMERHNMRSSLNDAEFHSDAERARIVIKLITWSFNFLKDKVRSSAEMHQRGIDLADHNAGEAIHKRRLYQLRRSRRMGHGPRH